MFWELPQIVSIQRCIKYDPGPPQTKRLVKRVNFFYFLKYTSTWYNMINAIKKRVNEGLWENREGMTNLLTTYHVEKCLD